MFQSRFLLTLVSVGATTLRAVARYRVRWLGSHELLSVECAGLMVTNHADMTA